LNSASCGVVELNGYEKAQIGGPNRARMLRGCNWSVRSKKHFQREEHALREKLKGAEREKEAEQRFREGAKDQDALNGESPE
jgi:hypothetical protein